MTWGCVSALTYITKSRQLTLCHNSTETEQGLHHPSATAWHMSTSTWNTLLSDYHDYLSHVLYSFFPVFNDHHFDSYCVPVVVIISHSCLIAFVFHLFHWVHIVLHLPLSFFWQSVVCFVNLILTPNRYWLLQNKTI